MRLPLSKVYRAFPELDRFSDAQCRTYLATARRKHMASGFLFSVASIGLAILIGVATSLAILLGFKPPRGSAWEYATLCFCFGGASIFEIMLRDFWYRRIIRKQIRSSGCPTCEYPLLGLQVAAGAVTCPECGKSTELAAIGLTPEDILASKAESAASPSGLVGFGADSTVRSTPGASI